MFKTTTIGVQMKTVACPMIEEWTLVGTCPNTLLIGAEPHAAAIIAQHAQSLRAPIQHWRVTEGIKSLPTTGTLVMWGVDTLSVPQQEELLTWMDNHSANVQLISVSEFPLYPLVLAGAFLDELYYRLNLVCLPLSSGGAHRAVPQPTSSEIEGRKPKDEMQARAA
jgi:hypothetical protein